ncbi:MAG TPA: hypothetical protein P5099_04050 [Candidatus Moranbacteria bacterium]|nr:hypothetical protein [Candidatus Moranbacteria bacterium]HSA08514.1 hypothetical protein [Candidatus Moranbacteria bacterium]
MEQETIKVSIKPWKIILIAVVIAIGAFLLMRSNLSKKFGSLSENQKEIILPIETGVSDSGFEGKTVALSVLNAKTVLDQVDEIEGKQSLKIYFSESPSASVKINDYINNLEEGSFYKLSFLAKNSAADEKTIGANAVEKEKSQDLGKFNLAASDIVQYVEFNFQAENSATDLVFTATDGRQADVWIDNVMIEKLNVNSADEVGNIGRAIFGDTSRFNVDQSQTESDADSGDFFAKPNVRMGQIFSPSQPLISGVALKIQKMGTGGAGNYLLQIREYDDRLGVISDDAIAERYIYTDYASSVLDEIKEKEQQMRDDFAQNEKDIIEGRTPNDETTNWYPPEFTQQQIDADKAQRRAAKLELAVAEMKASFNVVYEIKIPITAKLDTNKKYWIGVDNSKVKSDKKNYLKVFYNSSLEAGDEPGFISKQSNVWQEFYPLWFKTFYPRHNVVLDKELLSGATISDFGGGKFVYRYKIDDLDYTALSGFPGRKIYDIYAGNYEGSNEFGNYNLAYDQYATYKFNTIYPTKRIVIREAVYNQSLNIDFSVDGENWEEVFSDNPAEDNQKVNPFAINLEEKTATFYLRIRPAGDNCSLVDLAIEAELEK